MSLLQNKVSYELSSFYAYYALKSTCKLGVCVHATADMECIGLKQQTQRAHRAIGACAQQLKHYSACQHSHDSASDLAQSDLYLTCLRAHACTHACTVMTTTAARLQKNLAKVLSKHFFTKWNANTVRNLHFLHKL